MNQVLFDEALFDKNLTALARRNPALAQAVREAPVDADVVVEPAKDGHLTLSLEGRAVLSKYAPERDAQRICRDEPDGGSTNRVLVVLGFELGYVPQLLAERTEAMLHIVEPRLGVLRAALGAVDVAELLASERVTLYDRVNALSFRFEYGVRMEPNFALYALPALADPYREHAAAMRERIAVLVRDSHIHTFTNLAKQDEWFGNLVGNFRQYVGRPSVLHLRGALRGVPAVVVSAGPSLDKNAHLLEQWKGRGAIISVGTALQKCQQLGVAPDMTIALEANNITDQFHDAPIIAKSYLALMVKCHPDLWRVPAKGIFHFGNAMPDTQWMFRMLGCEDAILAFSGSVSTAAFSLAAFMGCNPIVFIGQDLAFGEGGASHATGVGAGGDFSVAQDKIDQVAEDEDMALVEGYHGGRVVTRTNLRNYLLWFEKHVPDVVARGVRVINSTEGGAKIHGAQQLPFAEATATLLGEPLPIGEMLDRHCESEPPDFDAVGIVVERTKKTLLDLIRRTSDGRDNAIKVQKLMSRANRPVEKINKLIHSIDRNEKRIFALAKELDELLVSVGGRDLFLVKTAFDYEGLNQEESLRLNMKQTATMYEGILKAARRVLERVRSLADDVDACRAPQS